MKQKQNEIRDVHTIQVDSALGAMKMLWLYRHRLSALGIDVELIKPFNPGRKKRVRKGTLCLTEPDHLKSFLAKLDRH